METVNVFTLGSDFRIATRQQVVNDHNKYMMIKTFDDPSQASGQNFAELSVETQVIPNSRLHELNTRIEIVGNLMKEMKAGMDRIEAKRQVEQTQSKEEIAQFKEKITQLNEEITKLKDRVQYLEEKQGLEKATISKAEKEFIRSYLAVKIAEIQQEFADTQRTAFIQAADMFTDLSTIFREKLSLPK